MRYTAEKNEFRSLLEIDEAHFDRMFDINVKGLLFATQAAANSFDGNGGSVINIGSLASQMAIPQASVYSATKAAVDSVTKTLAAELGPRKIRVNAILPGPVETEGTRACRMGAGSHPFYAANAAWPHRTADGHRQRGAVPGVRRVRLDNGPVIPVAGGLR